MVNEIHLSVDDGDFTPFADVAAAKKTICARALTYNLLTYKHATSDPWCGSVAALDRTSVPNCAAMLNVLTKCGLAPPSTATMPTPGLLLSPSVMVATDTYTLACGGGQSGGGGSAGAAGGGAAGGSGGANAGNGGAGEKAGNGSAGTSGANAGSAGQTAGTGSVGQTAGASGAGADGRVPAAAARPTSDEAGCTVAAAPTAGHGLGGLAALLAVSGMLRLRAARKSR